MKFYKRFPGDITIKTGDLSLVEFGAYDRLLDHYYAKEQPIDPDRVYTVARCQCAAERRAVDRVLAEYWTLSPVGWVQQRADEMIAEALPRIEAAKENGKKGGRPKGSKNKPSGFPERTQDETQEQQIAKASQSQNHISSVPNGTGSGKPPADPPASADLKVDPAEAIFALGVPILTAANVSDRNARSMLGMMRKLNGDPAVLDAITRCIEAKAMQPVEFLQGCLKSAKKATGKHTGFESNDYRKGVEADGSFA